MMSRILPQFLLIIFPALFQCILAGTWLSFNQNTGGGMELADRLLGAPFQQHEGKSIADVVAESQHRFGPEQNAQLAGLVRMCRERVKRSPMAQRNSIEHLDDLCAALLQLSKGQEKRRKRFSRFVPIRMDEEDLLMW